MKRRTFTQQQTPDDSVSITDGKTTYYSKSDSLQQAATDFAARYNHGRATGSVRCVATDLHTGDQMQFTCEALPNGHRRARSK